MPDYPFSSHWFRRGAQRLHYLDEGEGPPVLMVHGNPSWSYYWRHLVADLRADHRCVVPDHLGMGLSSRPAGGDYAHTLASRVDYLDALTTELIDNGGAPPPAGRWWCTTGAVRSASPGRLASQNASRGWSCSTRPPARAPSGGCR